MPTLLPLSVRVAHQREACVLDARLALAPGGLLFALRLAREMQVWLPRAFWALVDSAYLYGCDSDVRREPRRRGGVLDAQNADELRLWHAAWFDGSLEGAFNWCGDARRESVLPEGTKTDAVEQFEYLDLALGDNELEVTADAAGPLAVCGRQAIALAAMLAPEPAAVLTRSAGDGDPPLLGDARDRPLRCERYDGPDRRSLTSFAHGPRAGIALAHLRLTGVAVAAVHVVAPFALGRRRDDRDEMAPEPGSLPDPWRDAKLVWHPL